MSSSTTATVSTRPPRRIHGRVIAPDDAGYDEARTVVRRRHRPPTRASSSGRPMPTTSRRSSALARETGLELAVRSGGHSGAGHSVVDGGIVLDLRDLKSLDIDVDGTDGLGRDRPDRRRVHDRGRRARPRDRLRRHRLGRDRRDHARRRHRLSRPQVRPDDRLAAGRRDRDRRRPAPASRRRARTRTSSGRSAAAAATSASRRGSSSGCTRSPEFTGGMLMLPATAEIDRRLHRRAPRPRPRSCRRSPTSCRARRCRSCPRSSTASSS